MVLLPLYSRVMTVSTLYFNNHKQSSAEFSRGKHKKKTASKSDDTMKNEESKLHE